MLKIDQKHLHDHFDENLDSVYAQNLIEKWGPHNAEDMVSNFHLGVYKAAPIFWDIDTAGTPSSPYSLQHCILNEDFPHCNFSLFEISSNLELKYLASLISPLFIFTFLRFSEALFNSPFKKYAAAKLIYK